MTLRKSTALIFTLAILIFTAGLFGTALAVDEPSYYISIPDLPNITSSGWNSFDESISVKKGDSSFGSNKQLVVSLDSANDWNLVLSPDKSASIDYYIATSSTDTEAATMFTFTAASIDEGVSQDFGAIVSDFSTKPMGTYQDTITFTVEVQTTATDLSTLTADYTATGVTTLTGKLGAIVKISIADGATVILDSVDISGTNNESYNWAGITCEGNATIILSGDNIVRGFYENYPGIFISPDSTLTISGDGKLTASSNGNGAGIGGGWGPTCGNIVIEGGTITATGGSYAAGIGSGNEGSCGTITISGGTITANGGMYAAGIGGGYYGKCGTITISGGTITAAGGYDVAGIGGGYYGSCGNITITTGVTSVTATKGSDAPNSIGAGGGSGASCGTVTIGGTVYDDGITESPYTYTNLANITSDYTATGVTTLTGKLGANVKISVSPDATVILDSVDISGTSNTAYSWAGITCDGNATIILSGDNIVRGFYEDYPGIHIATDSTLTISGDGKLTASPYDGGTSSSYGAGIGGGYNIACGSIDIQGGTITATGGLGAAGIGGGYQASCGSIEITGGTITAKGGDFAPGIGGGQSGSCGNITITSGVTSVTATKGYSAPCSIGKGNGDDASCGTVTIGGKVYDDGITESPYKYAPSN